MINYERELQKQKENKKSDSAAENVIKFYNANRTFCDKVYNYFMEYKKYKNIFLDVENISIQSFKAILGKFPILIVTSNPIEEAIFLHRVFDYTKSKIKCFFVEDDAYQVACMGEYTIVHIHTKLTGEESARIAINAATKIFEPIYVLMLGKR